MRSLDLKTFGTLRFPSAVVFALTVSAAWLLAYNLRFWQETFSAMWHPAPDSVLFIISLALLVIFLQTTLLLLVPARLMRMVAGALCFVAAGVAYFSDSYGVFMDRDMLRNVVETDLAEATGLVSVTLVAYLLFFGLVPAFILWRSSVPRISWKSALKQRVIFFAGGLAVCVVAMLLSSASFASFFREHKPVRFLLNPAALVYEAGIYWASSRADAGDHVPTMEDQSVIRVADAGDRPLVLFVVVGETARSANFQLGGYERATNPQLTRLEGLYYFEDTSSCGTATATSVPCMFSYLGREGYERRLAMSSPNVLDTLSKAGIDVEWRDNNSGCKGVCERVRTIQYNADSRSSLCQQAYCYDEIMLDGLADALPELKRDTVVVFHQVGSHGPAYSERYPQQFEVFTPACHSNQLDRCSREEVRNAYDNSILYTDYNLSRQIELLQGLSDRLDSALIYVSDHGESLGENGVYLHGMPYSIAPEVQTRVPFILWMSRGYQQRMGISTACLSARSIAPYTHDNLYHTVLGAMGVRNPMYKSTLDVLAGCRSTRGLANAGLPARQS